MKTALVAAGGYGTRLRPITEQMPKPLLPVAGKPILQWILDLLCKHNIEKVIVTLSYKGDLVREYFGDSYKGMQIVYFFEEEPLGNVGAVNHLKEHLMETFFMIQGDTLAEIDLTRMYEHHRKNNFLVTIGLQEVEDPSPFSSVTIRNDVITGYFYKPKREESPSRIVNMGVQILEPEIVDTLKGMKEVCIDTDIIIPLISSGRVGGYMYSGQWFPPDTVEKYAIANAFWKPPLY